VPTLDGTMNKGIEVLIVEDSQTQAEQLKYLLEEQGYAVATAANGRQAFAAARVRRPTIIISDILMPEMDGYALCKAIKSDDALKDIPVILVTDLNSPQDVVMGLQCCADNFITKPYEPQFLLARITQSLRNRKLRGNRGPQSEVEIDLAGHRYVITAERHQILDLLIPTYEEAVRLNQKLREQQKELAQQVQERTADNAALAKEIAERKRAEEAVRASEERFRSVTQSANVAIISADSRGVILSWNKGATAIFGYAEAEVEGQPLTLLMPERYREAHLQGLKRVQAIGESRVIGTTVELHGLRKDGGEFPLELSLSSWKISGETFFSAIIRDITERKRMEEQLRRKNEELEKQNLKVQEANRLKSEFLANMSHELRTPLNSIIGFSQLMHDGKAGPLRPDQKEYMGDILTSSRHLLQLINDVLDLSKVESGKMEFFPELVEMKALVGEVRDILRSIAGSKRITVKTEVAPDLGAVTIDAAKFKQVLYNYLSNALKFTPDDGQVTVRVTPEGEDRFRLEVEDTGIGIKPDDIGRLFLEFQQLDASTAKKYPGTGLGLALTKRLVEAQSGSVGVRSTYGQGSVFFAVLPRTTYQVQQVERKQTAFPHKGSPKVLVIEDERKDRNWLSKTIGEAGYHVETATTGVEAIMKCREQVFDAIMLDLLLPDMNGRDVLAVIQEEGLNKRTPVIVVTVVSEKGIMAGYDVHDIFQKPVGGQQLLASLKRAGVKPNDSGPVLVVDDDPNMLKLGKRTLEKLGYNPICVESPRGALDMIAQSQPAAVVTDIRFPGTDVFEFLNRLRSTEAGRQIPVIVWTAGDATESLREKLQSSVRAVVLRSQGPAALVQAVQACVPLPATQAQAQKVSRGRRT